MSRAIARLLPLVLIPLASGCATAAMETPPDLAGVERLAVEGRSGWRASQRARFGTWEALDVDRSWTKGSGWRVGVGPIGGGSDQARQEYSFRLLEEGAERGTVRCITRGSRATATSRVVDVDLSAREGLECRGDEPLRGRMAHEPSWDLVLEATRDRHLEGFLRVGDTRYDIVSTGPGGGLVPATAYGFELRSEGRVVAAVETVNSGAVWLTPELTGERRTAFAGAAAALLLYERVAADD